MIGFDNGDSAKPAVFVYDIVAASSRGVAGGYLGPIWLGPDLLAATAADFCPVSWSLLGTTVGVDAVNGNQRSLALPSTIETVPIYGSIDVFLGIAGA